MPLSMVDAENHLEFRLFLDRDSKFQAIFLIAEPSSIQLTLSHNHFEDRLPFAVN